MPKPKAYSSKEYKKFHGIDAQKLNCVDQIMEKKKLKPNEKLSINVNTLVRSHIYIYIFISIYEIGLLT